MRKRIRINRWGAVALLALVCGSAVIFSAIADSSGEYAISRRVFGVPYEKALADFVHRLENVEGVTDAYYDDYDVLQKTAMVTVIYNPEETTASIITVWLGNTASIWEQPVIA